MASPAPIPAFLYGTAWKEERTEALTAQALSAGFRGIDTANQRKHYFEAAVGQALASSRVARSELFLQTKFTFQAGQDQRLPYDPKADIATQVSQSFASSLEHLGTDYLDSYLLHGPSTRGRLQAADIAAWRALETLATSGRTRFIGVSNVSLAQLRELLELCSVKPRFVQNRCYAKTGWDREIRASCREQDITYQGFSLLTANRSELAGKSMKQLVARTGRSAAELVFRFAVQAGMLPLTGTSSTEHLHLDLSALDFELNPADFATIEQLSALG